MYFSRKLALNSLVLFAGNVVSAVLAFAVSVLLVRYLGPDEFGRYSIVFAYLSFFHILTGAGIDTILIREVSIDPARKDLLASQAVLLRSLLSLGAVVVSWGALPFMGYGPEVRTWVHIASLGLLFGVRSVFSALFQAGLSVAGYALPELVLGLVFNAALMALIFRSAPVTVLIVLQTAQLLCLLIAFFLSAKSGLGVRLRLVIDLPTCRRLLSEALPLIFTGIFITVALRIDQLMIFRMLGPAPLGLYSAVVRIAESLNLIPGIYVTIVYPVMCAAHATSPDYFRKVYQRSMKYMSVIIIPLAFGATLLSGKIMLFLFGEAFLPAAGAFSWLMWAGVFAFLGSICGPALNAAGMQRYLMIYSGVGMAVNVILNLLLIPRFGIVGAAVASLNSYGGLTYLFQLADRRVRPFAMEYLRASAVPVAAGGAMTVFLYFIGGTWSLWVQVAAGAGFYFLALCLLRFFDAEDREYLRQIFLPDGGE